MASETETIPGLVLGWVDRLRRRAGLRRRLGIALAVSAIISVIATFVTLTGSPPFGPNPATVLTLLNINLVLFLLLAVLISRKLVEIWAERRRGLAGARLHSRLVLIFSLVAVTPAIVLAIFSALFFNIGIQNWFSERVETAVKEAVSIAEAYMAEHQKTLQADILAMAHDLNQQAPFLVGDEETMNYVLDRQSDLRGLTGAVVFSGNGDVLGQSGFSYSLGLDPVPDWALERAMEGEVALVNSQQEDQVRALIRLDGFLDAFLYVARFVDPVVLGHLSRAEQAAVQYQRLEGERKGLQITFSIVYVLVALLLLLTAIWVALLMATRLVEPIGDMVTAAESIGAGNLASRVEVRDTDDELATLGNAFNRMTAQLQQQQAELIAANKQLESRRRFTEAVLRGVSAGVIGLDREGQIQLPNRSAGRLLGTSLAKQVGQPLRKAVPEMADLLAEVRRRTKQPARAEITLERGGRHRTLVVQIAAEITDDGIEGFVVTFDDVTELVTAQRKAAWADVARRIAHEIKNPLTPIQLAAERLKRKFGKQIVEDAESFQQMTDTIRRQVGDIRRMVDEFSAFARMPAPSMAEINLGLVAREAIQLQLAAHPDISFTGPVSGGKADVRLRADARQLRQVITNLLQNAIDSIERRHSEAAALGIEPEEGVPLGSVDIDIASDGEKAIVTVSDDGAGLPEPEIRGRLTEPYVTTRAKGTGLGLAIVRKIMEDHGGEVILKDREGGGAVVHLVMPLDGAGQEGGDASAATGRKAIGA